MKMIEKLKEYHFEFKHLTLLFTIIFIFQLLVSFINKSSIKTTLENTQEWYQKDSAEKLANLTTTSLELLVESIDPGKAQNEDVASRIIESFNIILSQQMLQHNIDEICFIAKRGDKIYTIDEGKGLYDFLFNDQLPQERFKYINAVNIYANAENELVNNEQIYSVLTNKKTFNIFVPFVVKGECIGAVYMKNTPDFSLITNEIISNYDETSMVYLSLILLGLLAMYFISSYTVKERDEAQRLLFEEHEKSLKKQINYEKELYFTKRIYHTHHKAEKVMGFIKEDLRLLSPGNIKEIIYRVTKYSNFVSRVIYDMKWYDPPVQTIRNPIFQTNLNEVIEFITANIFQRIYSQKHLYNIQHCFDPDLPRVSVNEFIIWEILEPLIQNCIDHNSDKELIIEIKTSYSPEDKSSRIIIRDNGKGIIPEFLLRDESGIKKLFSENISSKESQLQNSGYGCYIAYTMCKRCGWEIDVINNEDAGCSFIINIK